jgi:uncharacterized protein (DUF2062 family)
MDSIENTPHIAACRFVAAEVFTAMLPSNGRVYVLAMALCIPQISQNYNDSINASSTSPSVLYGLWSRKGRTV